MNWRKMGAQVLVWALIVCQVEALSLVAWTDANRIEMADRIVIGTVEIKEDASIIKVEKVLKGAAEPKWITTKMKPHRRDLKYDEKTKNVLWVERGSDHRLNPLADFCYIKEGSPKWLLYHALVDPAPLARNEVFERNSDALQVLGYLFDPLKITSSDAPMVAERLMRLADFLPWSLVGVLDLECRKVPGDDGRVKVESMHALDKSALKIRNLIEEMHFDHGESRTTPEFFSLRIDARRIESIGSLSYEEAAGHLRRYIRMELDVPRSSDHSDSDHDRRALDRLVGAALISLKRMRNADSVPDVVLLAAQSDSDGSRAVFDFLASARDQRTLEPMCELLAEYAPKHPRQFWLSGGAAQVLGAIGDPAAVPYLEVGVRYGVQFAYFPLGQLGGVESMGTIIQANKDGGFEGWAHAPLYWMVKRSNLETEPWMELRQLDDGSRNDKLRAKWRRWWLTHKDEMKLVRTFEEARRGWEPQWSKDERSGKAYAKKHAWKYVSGVGLFLVLFFVYRARRKRA